MTPVQLAVEVAGWTGALLILAAYGLLSAGRLDGQSRAYQWMNVGGAVGFVINGWSHGALPSTALNVVWMLIGGFALWRIARRSSTSAT